MKLPIALLRLFAASAAVAASAHATTNPMPTNPAIETGYAPVNGLRLYYEIHGPKNAPGVPLVLLHGGGDTIETSFGRILPLLARHRRLIAFEQQGFGHTADIPERPFSFEQSAEDTVALLDYLHLPSADLFGFSNGGSIALYVAMKQPTRVRRIVAVTAIMKRAWVAPQFWEMMKTARPDSMPAALKEAYVKVAPHPENLESFFYKCRNRMRDFQDVSDDALRAITAPTLVVSSDRDVMLPEGALALSRVLPHAQLAILPGVDHMAMTSRTDVLVPMIEEFLGRP